MASVESIWLKIANVRMDGAELQFQVEGDASDDRFETWLTCSKPYPDANEQYKMVLKALQDGRKTSGKLKSDGSGLVIEHVRVQFQ